MRSCNCTLPSIHGPRVCDNCHSPIGYADVLPYDNTFHPEINIKRTPGLQPSSPEDITEASKNLEKMFSQLRVPDQQPATKGDVRKIVAEELRKMMVEDPPGAITRLIHKEIRDAEKKKSGDAVSKAPFDPQTIKYKQGEYKTLEDGNRQTGRTTRMVHEILQALEAGKPVHLLAASKHHADQILSMIGPLSKNVKVHTFGASLIGAVGLLFTDHYYYESEAKSAPLLRSQINEAKTRIGILEAQLEALRKPQEDPDLMMSFNLSWEAIERYCLENFSTDHPGVVAGILYRMVEETIDDAVETYFTERGVDESEYNMGEDKL